jgi:hypothetical protein
VPVLVRALHQLTVEKDRLHEEMIERPLTVLQERKKVIPFPTRPQLAPQDH